MGSRLVAHKLTDARQLHLGNANDNRDDEADDQDRGNAERVRPHMDEAYDEHEDDPDHRYCDKGEQIKSPPYPWRNHRSTHLSACDEPPPESRRDDRRREDDSERSPG
jgi:hypothetical protein